MARKKLPLGLAAIAALLLGGIGVSLTGEVKDDNNNTLAKYEIRDGKIKAEQDQKGIEESLRDSFDELMNKIR